MVSVKFGGWTIAISRSNDLLKHNTGVKYKPRRTQTASKRLTHLRAPIARCVSAVCSDSSILYHPTHFSNLVWSSGSQCTMASDFVRLQHAACYISARLSTLLSGSQYQAQYPCPRHFRIHKNSNKRPLAFFLLRPLPFISLSSSLSQAELRSAETSTGKR